MSTFIHFSCLKYSSPSSPLFFLNVPSCVFSFFFYVIKALSYIPSPKLSKEWIAYWISKNNSWIKSKLYMHQLILPCLFDMWNYNNNFFKQQKLIQTKPRPQLFGCPFNIKLWHSTNFESKTLSWFSRCYFSSQQTTSSLIWIYELWYDTKWYDTAS